MPFLRFSRDKRGYEHIYLVHAQNRRGKPARPRVLYWYRSPPGIRVGRPPFDEEMRRRLEAQNPDVSFDWETLANTPFPPPAENEQWRELRRAKRAARQAQRVDEGVGEREQFPSPGDELIDASGSDVDATPPDRSDALQAPDEVEALTVRAVAPGAPAEMPGASSEIQTAEPVNQPAVNAPRRRRRRGGRRRRGRGPEGTGSGPAEAGHHLPEADGESREPFEGAGAVDSDEPDGE